MISSQKTGFLVARLASSPHRLSSLARNLSGLFLRPCRDKLRRLGALRDREMPHVA